MDEEQINALDVVENKSTWTTVTPFSKYLALTLFVALPFLGFWVGYTYAPEKIVEVEKVVEVKKVIYERKNEEVDIPWNKYTSENFGFEFEYPDDWMLDVADTISLSKQFDDGAYGYVVTLNFRIEEDVKGLSPKEWLVMNNNDYLFASGTQEGVIDGKRYFTGTVENMGMTQLEVFVMEIADNKLLYVFAEVFTNDDQEEVQSIFHTISENGDVLENNTFETVETE
jgi:hypothetical protein